MEKGTIAGTKDRDKKANRIIDKITTKLHTTIHCPGTPDSLFLFILWNRIARVQRPFYQQLEGKKARR